MHDAIKRLAKTDPFVQKAVALLERKHFDNYAQMLEHLVIALCHRSDALQKDLIHELMTKPPAFAVPR